MKTFAELYPDMTKESLSWNGPGDYTPIMEAIGEVVTRGDDHDYQGSTYILFRRHSPAGEAEYGFLIFGWGSCSGCDALQGCSKPEHVEELAQQMENEVQWATKEWMLNHFKTYPWGEDYCPDWHDGCAEWLRQSIAHLEEVVNG